MSQSVNIVNLSQLSGNIDKTGEYSIKEVDRLINVLQQEIRSVERNYRESYVRLSVRRLESKIAALQRYKKEYDSEIKNKTQSLSKAINYYEENEKSISEMFSMGKVVLIKALSFILCLTKAAAEKKVKETYSVIDKYKISISDHEILYFTRLPLDAQEKIAGFKNAMKTELDSILRSSYQNSIDAIYKEYLLSKEVKELYQHGDAVYAEYVLGDDINLNINGPFLAIEDIDSGKSTIHIGGDQDWFSLSIDQFSGCGPTAGANIMAFMALHDPDLRGLYGYDYNNITRDDYALHMEDVIKYATPLYTKDEAVFVNETASRFGFDVYAPESLGIPYVGMLKKGVIAYGDAKGVELEGFDYYKPIINSDVNEGAKYIMKGLSSGSPVAVLNYWNEDLKRVSYTDLNGVESTNSFELHWVTITGIKKVEKSEEYIVNVSSWGNDVEMSFNDMYNGLGFGGMVYFANAAAQTSLGYNSNGSTSSETPTSSAGNNSGSLDGDVFGYETDSGIRASFSLKDKDGKNTANIGIVGNGSIEGHVAQGTAEGQFGYASGEATVTAISGEAELEGELSLYNNGRIDPRIGLTAKVEAAGITGEAEGMLGVEDFNVHGDTTGYIGHASAEAIGSLGFDGVVGEVDVGAAVFEGEVMGGFTIFGVDFEATIEGEALSIGFEAEVGITNKEIELGAKLSALLGLGIELRISWD